MALSAFPSSHSEGPADEGGRQVSIDDPGVRDGETKPPTAFSVGRGASSVSSQAGHASRAWTHKSRRGPSSNLSACGASMPPAANVALLARSRLTTRTERPRLASSRAVASPLMPPPTTTTSSFFVVETRAWGGRSAAAVVMRSSSILARGGRCAVPRAEGSALFSGWCGSASKSVAGEAYNDGNYSRNGVNRSRSRRVSVISAHKLWK